jgi:hypothetical protein
MVLNRSLHMQVTLDEKAGEFIIRIPRNDPPVPSKSGKTVVHASTRGNMGVQVNGYVLKVGLNIYGDLDTAKPHKKAK